MRETRYICQQDQKKACFQNYLAYGDYKDVPRRTDSDKAFHDKEFEIANNQQYDRYQQGTASIVYKFIDEISRGITAHTEAGVVSEYKQLANELYSSITTKCQISQGILIFFR